MDITVSRKLRVGIKDSSQSSYKIISSGIVEGSASLSEILFSEENLIFGSYNSSKFEITIDRNKIASNIRIQSGYDIQVYFEEPSVVSATAGIAVVGNAIAGIGEVAEDTAVVGVAVVGKATVNVEGPTYPEGCEPVKTYIFTGQIESVQYESSNLNSIASKIVHIVAYDKLYYLRDKRRVYDRQQRYEVSLSTWWKLQWAGISSSEPIPIYLYELRNSFCDFLGLEIADADPSYDDPSYGLLNNQLPILPKGIRDANYDFKLADLPNDITVSQMMSWICELQCVFPHINGTGQIEFIDLRRETIHDIVDKYEYDTSEISLETSKAIQGVEVLLNNSVFYDVIVDDGHYPDEGRLYNKYKIIDNFFIESMVSLSSEFDVRDKIIILKEGIDDILNLLQQVERYFGPANASFNMIYSDLDVHLGDIIRYRIESSSSSTIHQYYTRVTANNLSGPYLVEQTLEANAVNDYEINDTSSYSPTSTPESMYDKTLQPYFWSNTSMSDTTLADNTNTTIGSFTLPRSIGVIQVAVKFSTNATGIRRVWLSNRDGGTYISYRTYASQNAIIDRNTLLQLVVPINITTETQTFYIMASQNSGSSLTVTPEVAYSGIIND